MQRAPMRTGRYISFIAVLVPTVLLVGAGSGFVWAAVILPPKPSGSVLEKTQDSQAPEFVGPIQDDPGPNPSAASPVLGAGWDALAYSVTNHVTPPDVHLAAGSSQVVEAVNLEFGVFTKAGSLVVTHPLATFFGTGLDYITDPQVQYDARSGRWFLSVSDGTQGQVLLAVSRTSDATGTWSFSRVPSTPTYDCLDQPILGVGSLNVILSVNVYSECTSAGTYLGAQYWVLNKTQLASGSANPSMLASFREPSEFSLHPVRMQGDNPIQYLVSTRWNIGATSNVIELFTVTGSPPGTVAVTERDNVMRAVSLPPPSTQQGSGLPLDPDDFRVSDATWSGGVVWVGFNQRCAHPFLPATACVRLLELDPRTGKLVQDFDVASTTRHYLYPALALDGRGNLAVVFGFSSGSDYPGIMVTGRLLGDAPEVLQPPTVAKAGTGAETTWCPQSVCRYGDYFGASVDPSDPTQIWLAGEVGRGSLGWGTRIFAARVKAMLTLSFGVQSGGLPPNGPMVHYVADGHAVTAAIGGTPTTLLPDPGTAWNIDSMFTATGGQTRYLALANETANLNGTADHSVSEVLMYAVQYGLSIDVGTGGSVAYGSNSTNGTVAGGTASTIYVFPGSVVRLTARPSSGVWVFSGWAGDIGGVSSSSSITVDGPRAVRATFSLSWTFVASVVAGIDVTAVIAVLVLRRRRQKPVVPPPTPPPPPPDVPPKGPDS